MCIFWLWKMYTLNEMGVAKTTKPPQKANNPQLWKRGLTTPTLKMGLITPITEKGANNPPTLKSGPLAPNP